MAKTYAVLLIDASGYLFRAYHALPKLTNARGEPTGATVGFINMLDKLRADYRPEYCGVVFDAAGPTFRDELYPEYKAQRPPLPDDLRAQFAAVLEILRAQGLHPVIVPGVEADDVIATLATRASAAGLTTLIATGDKDLAQIVDERVTLIDTMSGQMLDRAGVIAKFGVPPERIVDYLSLVGDVSDHIPGVPLCGPKTAVKWLNEYGDLAGVCANATAIKGKVGENLRTTLERLPLTSRLVTVKRDVPLAFDLAALRPQPPDLERLRACYLRLDARRLLTTIAKTASISHKESLIHESQPEQEYEIVCESEALARWLTRLQESALLAVAVLTDHEDERRAQLTGVSLAGSDRAAYIPFINSDSAPSLNLAALLAALKPVLEDPARAKLGHDLKFSCQVLARYGIELRGIAHDTMLQSYVLDGTATRHDWATLVQRHLGLITAPPPPNTALYAFRLHERLWPQLQREPALLRLYCEIEIPLLSVLARMERTGVCIDVAALAEHSQELAARIAALETQAQQLAGRAFNLGSPKQIAALLFDEMKLPSPGRKTSTGKASTDEATLEQLAAEHELPRVILMHRTLTKLRATYTEKLPRLIDPQTGRLHTRYHQAVTATGRLSSSDPNLQNIPIRGEDGRRIRRAFIPAPGWLMLAADYSQIELRLMAHFSGDERLRAAFAAGQDIHRATAAEIYGVSVEQVTEEQRRAAKAINFGLMYGMSAFGLARQLGIGRAEAQEYVTRYFARYPGVQEFMEKTRAQAEKTGTVETLFGRRLRFSDMRHQNRQRKAAAERAAINAPLQGSAADLIKAAMITIDHWLAQEHPPVRLLLQVHDELVFEAAAPAIAEASVRIRAAMQNVDAWVSLSVPLVVSIGVGKHWGEAH